MKNHHNIFLAALSNVVYCHYLTETHLGFLAYSRKYLETVKFDEKGDDFIFDNQIIAQGMSNELLFEEILITTRCFTLATSINF